MSAQPQERLSTADMVAAGQPVEPPHDVEARPDETPANVRRLERPARMQSDGERPAALLPGDETGELRRRWDTIQTGFVDEPRHAVEEADSLVAKTISASPRSSPRNDRNWNSSGAAARTCRRRTSASPSSATAPSSTDS